MTADRTLAAIGYGSSAIELWDHQGAQVATVIPFGRTATLLISDRKSPRKEGLKGWGSRVDRLRSLAPPDRHANEPLRLDRYDIPHRFAPAGDILAYQGMYAQPRLIDLKTGSTAGTTDMGGHLSALAFSPDAKSLILGGNDSRIRVQALVPPDGHDSFPAHAKEVWGIAWSPDGKSLATSSDDGTIKTWDLDAKGLSAERAVLKGHVSLVTSVAWSPDGRFLASSGYNRDVRVWEAVQGMSRAVFKGHEGIVRMIAWSPDGRTLASCGNDRAVRFWDPYRLDHSPPSPASPTSGPRLFGHRLVARRQSTHLRRARWTGCPVGCSIGEGDTILELRDTGLRRGPCLRRTEPGGRLARRYDPRLGFLLILARWGSDSARSCALGPDPRLFARRQIPGLGGYRSVRASLGSLDWPGIGCSLGPHRAG